MNLAEEVTLLFDASTPLYDHIVILAVEMLVNLKWLTIKRL
jgi:hypothetical protein